MNDTYQGNVKESHQNDIITKVGGVDKEKYSNTKSLIKRSDGILYGLGFLCHLT